MVDIVAAILYHKQQVLIAKRLDTGECGGFWEFPGGKVEKNESLQDAIIRECQEELNVVVQVESPFVNTIYAYPQKIVNLFFMKGTIIQGQATKRVHSCIKWVDISALNQYEFCPANKEVIDTLLQCNNNK